MSNGTSEVDGQRGDLEKVLAAHSPTGSSLELVPSVQEWKQRNGMVENNPFRQAVCFPDRKLIVMRSDITADDARSSSSVLSIGPFEVEWLATDTRRYRRFLLLHEVGHLLGKQTEREADEWALARVKEIENS